jgi:hypothetical protein
VGICEWNYLQQKEQAAKDHVPVSQTLVTPGAGKFFVIDERGDQN